VLRYRLSEAATVTVDVLPAKGTKFLARLTRRAKAGARSLAFSGRVKGRTLRPGSYRLVVRATDASGNRSAARTVRFKVVGRQRGPAERSAGGPARDTSRTRDRPAAADSAP
jgi:hypothetical protein